MKVLVVGATGGSGRAAVTELVRRGHEVTALSRHATTLTAEPGLHAVRAVDGDATDASVVGPLVAGQDAVVVTLGISESAVRVRLRGPARTAPDVRSRGTRTVVDAMRVHGVRRLVVQTSYGVGETRDLLSAVMRVVFAVLLRPQIADTEVQHALVRDSGLDWVSVQPVSLTDDPGEGMPFASSTGEVRGTSVARARVGRFLAEAVQDGRWVGRTVALSGVADASVDRSATGARA
ncbi:NmrA family transcriptional regulator [Cellulomonas chitinilytica]|uniref:NmrA family transcriptional regulator n=1 Tax=Cellulomonas chitinilytica TaxID=398759 RepID=A0A919U0Q0_9CELL|nr:NAD(P)-binding oxidoreductase [Cellulomonas chitinilytica]GIG19747.1 NmrA family transcriptional regulator [Cellulomonas chitinilytica]